MTMRLTVFALFVTDQDQALRFYLDRLGFIMSEDKRLGDYRWLLVSPTQHQDVAINLELARTPEQQALVGRQAGQTCLCAGDRQLPSRLSGDRSRQIQVGANGHDRRFQRRLHSSDVQLEETKTSTPVDAQGASPVRLH
jgi:Glyoxalase/Bleomycin resistance protein/Dioxygenase superfamily